MLCFKNVKTNRSRCVPWFVYPVLSAACRAPLRTSFRGKQGKTTTTHALAGVPSKSTKRAQSVKTCASWNPFAQNSNTAGIVGAQGRDDYEPEDVEYYFNYSRGADRFEFS